MSDLKSTVIKNVANLINEKRRQELFKLYYTKNEFKDYIENFKKNKLDPRSKSKVWKKIATMPKIVDEYFQKTYGVNYFRDKDFFDRWGKEWKL